MKAGDESIEHIMSNYIFFSSHEIIVMLRCSLEHYYRMTHEKPARRLIGRRGRRSRTLYRKLNKRKCEVLTG